jgi:hypothetical protein
MNTPTLRTIASFVFVLVFAPSCKKESGVSGNELIGRWEATESYLLLTPGGAQTPQPVVAGNIYEFKPLQRFKSIGIVGIAATTCEGMYSLSSDSTLRFSSNCIAQSPPLKVVEITSNYFVIQNPPSPLDPEVVSRVKYTRQ